MLDILVTLHALHSQPATPAPKPAYSASQTLSIPATVTPPSLVAAPTYAVSAPNVAADLLRRAPATPHATAAKIASALSAADPTDPEGLRFDVVASALSYLGDPYVLGGSSRTAIDCSGLTMDAYRSVHIDLDHGVMYQDAVAATEPESEAEPGDLIVFDNEDHVGLYLGDNELVAAPAPGRNVEIEPLSEWSGVPFHFARLLPQGAAK